MLVHDIMRVLEGEEMQASDERRVSDWIRAYVPRPKAPKLPWSFEMHEYQIDAVNDMHKEQVNMKGPQGGFTEAYVWKVLCSLDWYQGETAIYTMPRDEDVRDFVKTRLKGMVRNCPRLQMLKKSMDVSERDSVHSISVGDSYCMIRPTFSERAAISQPAGILVHDEYDRSNQEVVGTFLSRVGHAAEPTRIIFSNPSYLGQGVDALYAVSDQKMWMIECEYCGEMQDMDWEPDDTWDKDYPPFIVISNGAVSMNPAFPATKRVKGEAYYACRKCGRELKYKPSLRMMWQAKYELPRYIEGKKFDVSGYHWLTTNRWGWQSAQRIVDEFNKFIELSGHRIAYNFGIGKPFKGDVQKLSEGDVKACQKGGLTWIERNPDKTLVLAADQGKGVNYVMLGEPWWDGEELNIDVVYAETTKKKLFDWQDEAGRTVDGRLSELRKEFYPAICVIDAQPNEENSYRVCYNSGGYMWRVYYSHTQKVPMVYAQPKVKDENPDYRVNANKTMCMDTVVRMVKKRKWGFPMLERAPGGAGEEIKQHLTKIVRSETIKNGVVIEKWENKPDHFANVMLYMYVGAIGLKNRVAAKTTLPKLVGSGRRDG